MKNIYNNIDDEVIREDEVENEADEADDRCWCKFYESCPTCFGS